MSAVATGLPRPLKALFVAAVVLFVGAAILQRAGPAGRSDPIASVDNGGPRGWLLLSLALGSAGRDVVRVDSEGALAGAIDSVGAAAAVVLVPPPEQTVFSAGEVANLQQLLADGARVVVVCDPDTDRQKRLRPVLAATGVRCVGDTETQASTTALAVPALQVFVRDGGRVAIDDDARGVLPLVANDVGVPDEATNNVVGAVVAVGAGELVVLGSSSILTNDGLIEADNARLLWWLARGRARIVVDERHHLSRGAAAWQRASMEGPGPVAALLCLALLVPLTILSLAPRRGELIEDDGLLIPAAVARVRGLAALLASSQTPLPSSSSSSSSSSTSSSTSSSSLPPPSSSSRRGAAP
jgi:hypothetical protein